MCNKEHRHIAWKREAVMKRGDEEAEVNALLSKLVVMVSDNYSQ